MAFAYSSEIFPLLNREQGMSFAVFVNLFGAGVLSLFVPELTKAVQNLNGNGQSSLLGVFVGLNFLSLLLIFFFVPETAGPTLGKHISLEEVNYIFGVSTVDHIHYQLSRMVPWALRRLGRWLAHPFQKSLDSDARPEGLYTWVDVGNAKSEERQRKEAALRIQDKKEHWREMW